MASKFRKFYACCEEWLKLKRHRIASSGEFLAKQQAENPGVAGEWDAKRWANLVAAKPEFADRCPWETFDGGNWAHLLCFQPKFAEKCPWAALDGSDWARLLNFQPRFSDKCDWSKLTDANWDYPLEAQPQFKDRKPENSKDPPQRKPQNPERNESRGRLEYVSRDVEASVKNGKVVSIRCRDLPRGE